MLICDRTWKKTGAPAEGVCALIITGPDMEEEYHLTMAECEEVRSFINEPSQWEKKGPGDKVREILRLKDKGSRSSSNNSAA